MQSENSRTGRFPRTAAFLAAVLALTSVSLASAPTAVADDAVVTLVGVRDNGSVGVAQALVVTAQPPGSSCGSVAAPVVTVFGNLSGTTTSLGTATFSTCVGAAYQFSFSWEPSNAGVWYLYAEVAGTQSSASRSAIAAIATTTRLSVDSIIRVGSPTTLTATVVASGGSTFSPQGTVQFSIVGGAAIGAPVALNRAVPSTAQIRWVPGVVGKQTLVATYRPADAGTPSANTSCGTSCASPPTTVQVTATGGTIYLANAPALSAGSPATLTAIVSVVPPSGTVSFTINGAVLASGVPVSTNGQARTQWTPPSVGQFTIGVTWAGPAGMTGSAQQTVKVTSRSAPADRITITAPNGSQLGKSSRLRNGLRLALATRTASGAAVAMKVTGPCVLDGRVLSITHGNGVCQLTATSSGGNGYAAAVSNLSITATPGKQRARLRAPSSGRERRDRVLILSTRTQGQTNAGQQITWRVRRGAPNVCALQVRPNGSVRLDLRRRGMCRVVATAPAVSGEWNSFRIARTYRVR